MRKDKRGSEMEPALPQFPPLLGGIRLTLELQPRPDAGVLIAVDRSSKQCLSAAESDGVSLWVKGRSFTEATLVDNPLSDLKARLCNLAG